MRGKASLFLLVATFGYFVLFYRLHQCKECKRQLSLDSASMDLMVKGSRSRVTRKQIQKQQQQQQQQQQHQKKQRPIQNITTTNKYLKYIGKAENGLPKPTAQPAWVYNWSAWRPLPESQFKIPFPVFVASLPKSGTTSIYAYFLCGGVRSIHTYCPMKTPYDSVQLRIGAVMEENVKHGRPPFQGCGKGQMEQLHGPVKVFSDTGYVLPTGPCYYPSISGLDAMVQAYPHMTILLGTRNSTKWFQSLLKWNRGGLMWMWTQFCPSMPRRFDQRQFVNFYEWHNQYIRQFVKQHPSVTLLEVEIDSPTVATDLERLTNIPSTCWGHYRPKG